MTKIETIFKSSTPSWKSLIFLTTESITYVPHDKVLNGTSRLHPLLLGVQYD